MSRIKWAFAALIIFATLFGSLRTAQAAGRDPYLNNNLRISLSFEYDRDTTKDIKSDYENIYSSFEQRYTLDVLGNIFSRWLMTYDAGLHFARRTTTSASTSTNKITTHEWYYYFSTSLLPKSNIPLTLYINKTRTTNFTLTNTSGTWTTRLNYGLIWRGIFRTLPKIYFKADSNSHRTENTHTVDSTYTLNLKKNYKSTTNTWENVYTTTENKKDGLKNNQISTNITNITKISRATQLTVFLAASSAELSNGDTTSVIGMGSALTSSPSKDFNQQHNYNYTKLSQEGTTETTSEQHVYSGSMRYKISDRVSSSSAVTVNTGINNSVTTVRNNESTDANANISYRATNRLNFSENVSYRRYTSTSQDVFNTNFDDRTELKIDSRAGYSDNYSWASFSASGAAGYSDIRSSAYIGGKGLTMSASSSLSRINLVPFVTLGTSGSFSRARIRTSKDINSTTSYSFNANNSVLKRFALLTGSYAFSKSDSTAIASGTDNTTVSYSAATNYIKSLPMNYSWVETKTFNFFDDSSRTLDKTFNISHERVLLNGEFNASFSYKVSESSFRDGVQNRTTKLYRTSYKRNLTRNSIWSITGSYNDDELNKSKEKVLDITNSLAYQLRSWLIQAEYAYSRRTQLETDTVETRLIVKAGRSFGFSWR